MNRKLNRIEKHLEPIVNNDQLIEILQSIYDKYSLKINSNEINNNNNNIFTSKIARRLLVLVFVEQCHEKINQITCLNKLFPLIFRSNQIKINSHRAEILQDKILPYLQDLLQIYQILLWISSCGIESSSLSIKIDDR